MLNKDTIMADVESRFAGEPQKLALASRASDELFAALSALTQVGVVLQVAYRGEVNEDHVLFQKFPMMVRRGDETLQVEDEDELAEAEADGWSGPQASIPVAPAPEPASIEPQPNPEPDPNAPPDPAPAEAEAQS